MGIVGNNDERRVIRPEEDDFTNFPLPAVTAIDTVSPPPPGFSSPYAYGSGIIIAPNYVLTAAHVVRNYKSNANVTDVRVTTSANATPDNLISRDIGTNTIDPAPNVNPNSGIYYPFGTNDRRSLDVALLKTDNRLLDADKVVGLIAFLEPERNGAAIKGRFPIQTAGYPADNIPNVTTADGIDNNTGLQLRDLTLAPGSFNSFGNIRDVYYKRQFLYTEDIDAYNGQSGSGIWHTLEGDTKPRVLGVHNYYASGGGFGGFNAGLIFDTEFYYKITEQIENGQGIDGNDLPENAIIGTDPSFFDPDLPPIRSGGNDNIFGTYRKERILGNRGNDRIFGGGADDRLEGGEGTDIALFSDPFFDSNNNLNYNWEITNAANIDNPEFEFDHTGGSQADGKDTTKEIEFAAFEYDDANRNNIYQQELFYVPLQADPDNPSKLRDGPEITFETDILDEDSNKQGEITVTSPDYMFDGDVNYTLNIGSEQGTLYNFAYIIDKSGSMGEGNLSAAKSAYNSLTRFLINEGIAEQSEFGVVQFNSSARLIEPPNATLALAQINLLYAEGGTNFAPALAEAQNFFSSRNDDATNIAYFLSDGYGSGASDSLQSVAEVRAFGIGGGGSFCFKHH